MLLRLQRHGDSTRQTRAGRVCTDMPCMREIYIPGLALRLSWYLLQRFLCSAYCTQNIDMHVLKPTCSAQILKNHCPDAVSNCAAYSGTPEIPSFAGHAVENSPKLLLVRGSILLGR